MNSADNPHINKFEELGNPKQSGAFEITLTDNVPNWCLVDRGEHCLLFTDGLSDPGKLGAELVIESRSHDFTPSESWQHQVLALVVTAVLEKGELPQTPHLWSFPDEGFNESIVSNNGTVDVLMLEKPVELPAKLSLGSNEFFVRPLVVLRTGESELFVEPSTRNAFLEGLRRGNGYRSGLSRAGFVHPYDKKCWDQLFQAQDKAEANPDDAKTWFKLAYAYSGLADTPKAVECFLKVLEMDPDYPKIYAVIADTMYQDAGYEERSLPYFHKAFEQEPEKKQLHWGYVGNLARLNRLEEVKEHLLKTAQSIPIFAGWPKELGEYYLNREDWPTAETCLEAALELEPDDKKIARDLSKALGPQKKYQRLIEVLDGAAERAFEFFSLGVAFRFCQNQAREMEAYGRALELSPGHRLASINLGSCLSGAGKEEESQKVYEASLERYPDDPLLNGNLGFLYIKLGQLDKARKQLEKSLEIEKNVIGLLNLGHVYLCSKQNQKCLETYSMGWKLIPPGQDFVAMMEPDFNDLKLDRFVEREDYLALLAKVVG